HHQYVRDVSQYDSALAAIKCDLVADATFGRKWICSVTEFDSDHRALLTNLFYVTARFQFVKLLLKNRFNASRVFQNVVFIDQANRSQCGGTRQWIPCISMPMIKRSAFRRVAQEGVVDFVGHQCCCQRQVATCQTL